MSSVSSLRRPSRPGGRLVVTIALLVALGIGVLLFFQYFSDWLWYRSVDAEIVFTRLIFWRIGLFVVFGTALGLVLWLNLWLAYRLRPKFLIPTADQESVERYRQAFDPVRRAVFITVPVLLGLLAGLSGSADFRTWLLWIYGEPFGVNDKHFGMELGFFFYDYPVLRLISGFIITALLFSIVAAAVMYYLYGGLRLQPRGQRASPAAQTHLGILFALFFLAKAFAYWLDRYGLALQDNPLIAGMRFVDVNATLPAKTLLIGISLIVAVLFLVAALRRRWRLAVIGVAAWLFTTVVIGGVYPALLQNFVVRPSEADREAPYIARNIEATRDAYGIADVVKEDYPAKTTVNETVLATQTGTLEAIRIMDPGLLSPTFRQLQQVRGYYGFPDVLDVDRYDLSNQVRGSVVAARELNLSALPPSQQNWINTRLIYTHGFGLVAAYDNQAQIDGRPIFFEADIPPVGELEVDQPRIYFGQQSPEYSIVGAPDDADPRELDFPDDASPNGQRNNTYSGNGGVSIGNFFMKLIYAVKFGEINILLSNLVNEESQILYIRDPRDRIGQVAPWLTLDSDPYPSVIDGRIVWIVDGYTTSAQYPYSTRTFLDQATVDSRVAASGAIALQQSIPVNYIRNSIKATVDAYEGTVTLYQWDDSDPLVKSWSKAFPGVVKPRSEMPDELLAHVRYPQDIFKVQRTIMSRYHVTDPLAFYSGQDFWVIPIDPTSPTLQEPQPPYYLQLQMPGAKTAEFSLTTTFAPVRRQTLASFMAVNSQVGDDYGKIRVLQLPRNTVIPGPVQVQNNFESNPDVGSLLNLLRRGGSEVELGNLLSLPIGDGILYVEPVYIRAAAGESYPLLRRVLASFGDQVVFEENIDRALEVLLGKAPPSSGLDEGALPEQTEPALPEQTEPSVPEQGEPPAPEAVPPAPVIEDPEAELADALADMQRAVEAGRRALANGDFTAYGQAQRQLEDALARAVAAERALRAAGISSVSIKPARTSFLARG